MPKQIYFLFSFLLATLVASAQQPAPKHTDAALMTRLFGNYDSTNSWSIWHPEHIPKEYDQYFENDRGRTSLELDQIVTIGSIKKRYVVFSTLADGGGYQGCHACGVLLSAMVFASKGKTPKIREDYLMSYGQEGQAPTIRLRRLGRDHVAFEFTQDYCMGGDCEGSLFLFADIGHHLQKILALRSDNDDSNLNICSHPSKEEASDCKADPTYCFGKADSLEKDYRESCTSWTGSLFVAEPRRSTGWSDLVFTQRVKAARPGAFQRKSYRTKFHFTGTSYKQTEPPSGGPSIDIDYYRKH